MKKPIKRTVAGESEPSQRFGLFGVLFGDIASVEIALLMRVVWVLGLRVRVKGVL